MILLIVGASVDFAGARGTRLKNAALENMWRLRRRKLKLKKPLRLKRRKKAKNKAAKKKKNQGANKAAVGLPGTTGTATAPETSSSSEERSPG